MQRAYRRIYDGEPVGGRLSVIFLTDEHHVQRAGLDLLHFHAVEQHAAQGCGRRHGALDQPDHGGAPERQVSERVIGRPEAVQHQLADVLHGQALQRWEQSGRVVEQLHVAHGDARQRHGTGEPGRRQRHEPAAGQRQFSDGRQQLGVLFPDDQQLKRTKTNDKYWVGMCVRIVTQNLLCMVGGEANIQMQKIKIKIESCIIKIVNHRSNNGCYLKDTSRGTKNHPDPLMGSGEKIQF